MNLKTTTHKDLSKYRDFLAAQLKAVDLLLAGMETKGESLPTSAGMPPSVREEIKAVLRGRQRGLKPRQVTTELKSRGFSSNGGTALGTRVANEMWRMWKKAGILKKTPAGNYLYKDRETEEVPPVEL